MPYHVFVVMPFGEKEGIDFNRVYQDLIKPALEEAGLEPFRADQETLPGDIRADMFQELLMADLVVADLSINNPNAWYELGVRHGLRARGVMQIRCSVDRLPFDVCVDRTVPYHVSQGVPDPEFLQSDRAALARSALDTLRSWHGRRISPVYRHLPSLQEPDWKSLRVRGADGFWEQHENWSRFIEIARRKRRPGDVLVLADEAPTNAFRSEGYRVAGGALRSLGQYALALEQFEKALKIDPTDLISAQQRGVVLGRLGRSERAREWLKDLLKKHSEDAETWALLGRVEKDRWVDAWRVGSKGRRQMREDAAFDEAQLGVAIDAYRQGFVVQPSHYYSGINALMLIHLFRHLTGGSEDQEELRAMEGGIRWAVTSELKTAKPQAKNYWAYATLAGLELLVGDVKAVERAHKLAVAAADDDWFALDSTLQQIQLMRDLGFRPAKVKLARKVIERAIAKLRRPADAWHPRQVILFSGHMIDAPGRDAPRFPADQEAAAVEAVRGQLDALEAGAGDLAMCGGACGGDLLFAETCLERGLRLEIRIPFDIPEFVSRSVSFAGGRWRDRFYAVTSHPNTVVYVMSRELGPPPQHTDPFERDNLWQLYSAISWGPEKVRFICLWDGGGGDGPGGTRHMYESVKNRSGRVYVIDSKQLFNLHAAAGGGKDRDG